MRVKIIDDDKEYFFKIQSDNSQKNKWYCVMKNPFKEEWETKILWGSSVDVVRRRIIKQFTKYKEEC